MTPERLVSLLRCPLCHADVVLVPAMDDGLVPATVCCTAKCSWHHVLWHHPLAFTRSPEADQGFNERWTQHPKPQATTAGVLTQKTGLTEADLRTKLVLDAGCGCGRFSAIASSWGAEVGQPFAQLRASLQADVVPPVACQHCLHTRRPASPVVPPLVAATPMAIYCNQYIYPMG